MQSDSRNTLWWIGAAAVVAWRVAAFVSPHPAFTDSQAVRVLSGAVGLVFLACGAWVALRASGSAARVFRRYALAGGVHWGGAATLGPEAADPRLLALYLVVGVALAASLFLHRPWCSPNRPGKLGAAAGSWRSTHPRWSVAPSCWSGSWAARAC